MPKKPADQIKKPLYIRLSPESLMYIKQLSKETCRDVTNVIEYLIFLHSNKELPEPIPTWNRRPKNPKTEAHDSHASGKESEANEELTPIYFNERMENPYAKDD
jgi:hypothetical protein